MHLSHRYHICVHFNRFLHLFFIETAFSDKFQLLAFAAIMMMVFKKRNLFTKFQNDEAWDLAVEQKIKIKIYPVTKFHENLKTTHSAYQFLWDQ